jgi:SAM-dependent methyltransferase
MKPNEILDINRRSYDIIARNFSETRQFLNPDIKALVSEVKAGESVLDLGCGNGRLFAGLRNNPYIGVDSSAGLIAEAKKNFPQAKFVQADVLTLKTPQQFDVIFMLSVLNHFPKKYHAEIVKKVSAMLKPGGKLLMINWNMWKWAGKKNIWRGKHVSGLKGIMTTWQSGDNKSGLFYYAFTKGELNRLFVNNGLEVQKNYYSEEGREGSLFKAQNIVTMAVKK